MTLPRISCTTAGRFFTAMTSTPEKKTLKGMVEAGGVWAGVYYINRHFRAQIHNFRIDNLFMVKTVFVYSHICSIARSTYCVRSVVCERLRWKGVVQAMSAFHSG